MLFSIIHKSKSSLRSAIIQFMHTKFQKVSHPMDPAPSCLPRHTARHPHAVDVPGVNEEGREGARKIGEAFHRMSVNNTTKSSVGKRSNGKWQVVWGELLTSEENEHRVKDGRSVSLKEKKGKTFLPQEGLSSTSRPWPLLVPQEELLHITHLLAPAVGHGVRPASGDHPQQCRLTHIPLSF